MIIYYPVDLFWHLAVKDPESRLDMGNRNMKLGSSYGTSKG